MILVYIIATFICISDAQKQPNPGQFSQETHQKRWEKYYQNIRDSKEDVNLLAAVGSPLPSDVRPVTGPFGKSGRPAIEFTPQSYVGRFAKDIVPVPFFFNFGLKVTVFLQSLHGGVIFSLLKPDHSEILLSVSVTKADDDNQNIEFIYQNGDDVFEKKTFKAVFTLPKFVRRWVIFSISIKGQTVRLFFNGCEKIYERTFKRTRTPIKIYPTSPLFIGMAGWYIKKPVLFGALYDLMLMKNHKKAIPSCARRKIDDLKRAKDYKSSTSTESNQNTTETVMDINEKSNVKNANAENAEQNNESENSDGFFTKVESNEILSGPQISNKVNENDYEKENSKNTQTHNPTPMTTNSRLLSTRTDPRTTEHKLQTNPHYVTTLAPYTEDNKVTQIINTYPTTTKQSSFNVEDTRKAKDLINKELHIISKTIEDVKEKSLGTKSSGNAELIEKKSEKKKESLRDMHTEIVSAVVNQVSKKIDEDHCAKLLNRSNIKSVVTEILKEKQAEGEKKKKEKEDQKKTSSSNPPLKANIVQTVQDLELMLDMFPMGSFVFVSSTNQLFIKSISDWLEILTKQGQEYIGSGHQNTLFGPGTNSYALHDHQVFRPSEKERLLQNNLILPPAGIMAKRPYLIMAALNEPSSGHLGGIGGADYKCYKQANKAGLSGGTFRAFLADRYQGIKHLVSEKYAHLPVANFRGDQLFESYSSIYSTDKYRAFNPKIPIYSFDTNDVRLSSRWPIKKFWHGSLANGENEKAQKTCKNWRSDAGSSKGYSSSLISVLPALNEGVSRCHRKLIVLCIQVAVS